MASKLSLVIRLIMLSRWLPMKNKRHCPHIGLYMSVFIDFRWKLVILMAVDFENNFSKKFSEHKLVLNFLSWTVSQSQ